RPAQVANRGAHVAKLEVHEGAPAPAFGEVRRLLYDVIEEAQRAVVVLLADGLHGAPEQQVHGGAAGVEPDPLDALDHRFGGVFVVGGGEPFVQIGEDRVTLDRSAGQTWRRRGALFRLGGGFLLGPGCGGPQGGYLDEPNQREGGDEAGMHRERHAVSIPARMPAVKTAQELAARGVGASSAHPQPWRALKRRLVLL